MGSQQFYPDEGPVHTKHVKAFAIEQDPVTYTDAGAYARWAGRCLPSEAEWECPACAGSTTTYAWGEEVKPDGQLRANTWQGHFPARTSALMAGSAPLRWGRFRPMGLASAT
jgi:sulfatase modifying factor 1